MSERLLLLLSTRTYKAGSFLAAAERLGLAVTVASDRRQALAGLAPGANLTLDFRRPERAAAAALRHHREHPFDAVVAADDEGLAAAAAIAGGLGLRSNPPAAVAAALSKLAAREAFEQAGLATPWFRPCRLDQDPAAVAPGLRYPLVVKPLDLSASRGVIRADDPQQFAAAFRRLRQIVGSNHREILIEGYLPGDEVALEGLLRAGRLRVLAILDKPDPLEGPFFEETIYVTPSRHPGGIQRDVVETTQRAVNALGLVEGPIHAELRVGDRGACMLEVAPRSIGGLCAEALRFEDPRGGGRIALEELVLRHALGRGAGGFERERAASGVMMIPVPRAGILERVEGLQSAERVAGIEAVRITAARGQPIAPAPEGSRYLGFLFARAETPAAVETALRTAHQRLHIEVRPEPQPPDDDRKPRPTRRTLCQISTSS